ncbi:MAG TPA: DUF6206 family protein [Propionicimonas sp.]|nr:DUF6206 family protein [Propionicimonas sp.]
MDEQVGADAGSLAQRLVALEEVLVPARPESAPGLRILGYGEVSAVLVLADVPGLVLKRMAGFADVPAAETYRELVTDYIAAVRSAGVPVLETRVLVVRRPGRGPVTYLVQPEVAQDRLGHSIMRTADDATHEQLLHRVLDALLNVRENAVEDVAVDAQLSTGYLASGVDEVPVLLDVGTPFVRRGGRQAMDAEIILSTAPAPLRPIFRRLGTVHTYFEDYFEPRTAAVDLLGNYHKEGRPDRIDAALEVVNQRLKPLGASSITRREVDRYYRSDARLLGFWLQARRAERAIRLRAGQGYDFILPGRVQR